MAVVCDKWYRLVCGEEGGCFNTAEASLPAAVSDCTGIGEQFTSWCSMVRHNRRVQSKVKAPAPLGPSCVCGADGKDEDCQEFCLQNWAVCVTVGVVIVGERQRWCKRPKKQE